MPVEIIPHSAEAKRPLWRSIWRGFGGHCPQCGEGNLFRAFLKPVDRCAVCGEDMTHQRADDAPPYITIAVVGHILVPVMLTVQLATDFSVFTYLAMYLPFTVALALLLIQPVKGGVIGLQWALRMHGFDGSADPDAMPEGFLPPTRP